MSKDAYRKGEVDNGGEKPLGEERKKIGLITEQLEII